MNIVYVHTHDTGRYIQPYGQAMSTPNLQRFAEESLLFRHAYCGGPSCSPSRSALLTGMYAHSCGMTGLAHMGARLTDYGKHLAHYLGKQGYVTALAGIQHEVAVEAESELGYTFNFNDDNPHGRYGKPTEADLWNCKRAAAFIATYQEEQPFFLSVGLYHTHRVRGPFPDTGNQVNPNYVVPPYPMYDCQAAREDMADYMASAAYMDNCVGIVLDALEQSGRNRDTIVMFTTDHGLPFPQMKCNLFDSGIGVSLMLKAPGYTKPGTVSDALVSHVDLFPTLCEWAGLEKPAWLQGVSLAPLVAGETDAVREAVYAEMNYHVCYEPARCIRTNRYKLIRRFDPSGVRLLDNMDGGKSKQLLMNAGYFRRPSCTEALYDLYLDPVERENVYDDESYREIRNELDYKLTEWMKNTNDPLLAGPVRSPYA